MIFMELMIEWGVAQTSGPDKDEPEDTWFIVQGVAAGVFDGVGGWREDGINPAPFTRDIANGCWEAIESGDRGVISILNSGYKSALKRGNQGSCTATIVLKTGPRQVTVANLGDSGLAVFRDGKKIFQTEEQQYDFNYPYSLSSDRDAEPSEAERTMLTKLKSGDYLVLASDGLWDNLYPNEISHLLDDEKTSEEIATDLTVAAFFASDDPRRWAPFGQKYVEKLYGQQNPFSDSLDNDPGPPPLIEYLGGKPDDITVLVGRLS
jgi:protein phosphatase PTC7